MHMACPPPIQPMIDHRLSVILSSFRNHRNSVESICMLKDMTYENGRIPDYSNELVRDYYLLRYFYGYFAEYYFIFSLLFEQFQLREPISIASIGCGAGIDYYALKALKWNATINYYGYDIIDWGFRNRNASFDLINIADVQLQDINILMFPKSLSEFSQTDFDSFVNNLAPHSLRYPFCVISSMMDKGGEYDIDRIKLLERSICNAGYKSHIDSSKTFHPTERSCFNLISARCPDTVVDYLNNIKNACEQNSSCNNCHIDKNPILTTDYVRFQILCFTET